jgi:Na+-translocating ferredoxin:NAD+ oxidoreductase RnfC subunit
MFRRNVTTMDTTKTCSKCGAVKLACEFPKGTSRCKPCRAALKARYYAENAQAIRARHARYYAENAEAFNARHARYRAENAEALKAYRAENAEALKAGQARYRAENAEAIKARLARYRSKLASGYVALLLGIPVAQVPEHVIELKRSIMRGKRLIRQLDKEIENEPK